MAILVLKKHVVKMIRLEYLRKHLSRAANMVVQRAPFSCGKVADLFFMASENQKTFAEEILIMIKNQVPEVVAHEDRFKISTTEITCFHYRDSVFHTARDAQY